jgi:hypothetical protein
MAGIEKRELATHVPLSEKKKNQTKKRRKVNKHWHKAPHTPAPSSLFKWYITQVLLGVLSGASQKKSSSCKTSSLPEGMVFCCSCLSMYKLANTKRF